MPKELHKMKTSIINNCFLSLIVIENEIHNHIIYNEKAAAFKDQFDKCVETVADLIKECGTTKKFSDYLISKEKREQLEEQKESKMEVEPSSFAGFDHNCNAIKPQENSSLGIMDTARTERSILNDLDTEFEYQ